jgi:hypothetical protein
MDTETAAKGDMDIEIRAAVVQEFFSLLTLTENKGIAFFPNSQGIDEPPGYLSESTMTKQLKRDTSIKREVSHQRMVFECRES